MSEFFKIICQDCGDECFQGGKDGITWICPTCDNDPVKPPAAAQGMAQAVASKTLVRRSYWSGNHSPYPWMVFSGEAEQDKHNLFAELLASAGVNDGDEFIIIVEKTGNRPFGDRRIILQRAHEYGPETDEQMTDRLKG